MKENAGAVMVVGGGISGVQTALDLAESGFKVFLVEKKPTIGAVMAQLDKTFPTNDCSMCILSPKLVEASRHPLIELMTLSEVESVEGEAPNFTVTIKREPRYVDVDKCTGCGLCAEKCPVKVPSEYEMGLAKRKAIYISYPQAVPLKYAIDSKRCLMLTKGWCGMCEMNCPADAIHYEDVPKVEKIQVGAIVVAVGFGSFDARLTAEYGYGLYPNVLTSLEFERMLSASGPYEGHVQRPSDGKPPQRIAFLQCVGSRDVRSEKRYCSSVCCMHAIKQAIIVGEHIKDVQPEIFAMDIRAVGKEFEDYRERAEKEYNVKIHRATRVASIEQNALNNNLILNYSEGDEVKSEEFDLVILSVGFQPPEGADKLAKALGIDLNRYGFASTNVYSPISTSRPGIFVSGAFAAPKDIPTTVAEASGAAAKAGALVADQRIHLEKPEVHEIDVVGQEPRIGVFVCDCGINIKGTVNVPEVVEYAKNLPNVVYAEENKYTCSADAQSHIRSIIKENNLNRVVIASCTPRTHEPLFQNTLREAGLNPFLFEMANIRDQCSWTHMHEPDKATEKAKDLVRMSVARSRLLEPLEQPIMPVNHSVVVIGGGVSGMIAALDLSAQNFQVNLLEKTGELGGNALRIYHSESGSRLRDFAKELAGRVMNDKNITVHLNAVIEDISGYVGSFKVRTSSDEIDAGAILVTTGGSEYRPHEYLYGQDDRVVTQLELEEKMARGPMNASTVAMIQCVGSRTPEAPYCSRICCINAIRNAVEIKRQSPKSDVYVFHKDIRTYGFKEDLYYEASELGVKFVRVPDDQPPSLKKKGNVLELTARDTSLGEDIAIKPDLVVLSTGIRPNPDNEELAKMLKVPLSKDKFFLEAHMKLRPVDFATEGIYLAGLAHWPKLMDESIAQASGAAARAITVASKDELTGTAFVPTVDQAKCKACGTCEEVCAFKAVSLEETSPGIKRASVNPALCKGCGGCAAVCPTGAIAATHFTDKQLLSAAKSILEAME